MQFWNLGEDTVPTADSKSTPGNKISQSLGMSRGSPVKMGTANDSSSQIVKLLYRIIFSNDFFFKHLPTVYFVPLTNLVLFEVLKINLQKSIVKIKVKIKPWKLMSHTTNVKTSTQILVIYLRKGGNTLGKESSGVRSKREKYIFMGLRTLWNLSRCAKYREEFNLNLKHL